MRTATTMLALLALPALVWGQAGTAQKPAAPAPAPGAAAPAQPAAPPPPPQEPYTYNPENRRDPFVSLVSRGVEGPSGGKRTVGLSGLTTAELTVKGVMQSQGAYLALVVGPDGKTFTAHVNDRLADGTIRSITPQGLVIMQDVNDPLSLVKTKEVRKGLRAPDDGKQ